MQKQRYKHLITLLIHFLQFCCPSLRHKNVNPVQLGQVLKWHKIHGSNTFVHFLSAVSLGSSALKMSEKFRWDRKIYFQNTFYTKRINNIIDSIGPSIILKSIIEPALKILVLIAYAQVCSLNVHAQLSSEARYVKLACTYSFVPSQGVRAVKALSRLCLSAGSSEPSLGTSTNILYAVFIINHSF